MVPISQPLWAHHLVTEFTRNILGTPKFKKPHQIGKKNGSQSFRNCTQFKICNIPRFTYLQLQSHTLILIPHPNTLFRLLQNYVEKCIFKPRYQKTVNQAPMFHEPLILCRYAIGEDSSQSLEIYSLLSVILQWTFCFLCTHELRMT